MSAKIPFLFFPRGHGRGHAIPDMAIADYMASFCPDIDIRLTFYAKRGIVTKTIRLLKNDKVVRDLSIVIHGFD